jgi:hypothetical protein
LDEPGTVPNSRQAAIVKSWLAFGRFLAGPKSNMEMPGSTGDWKRLRESIPMKNNSGAAVQ